MPAVVLAGGGPAAQLRLLRRGLRLAAAFPAGAAALAVRHPLLLLLLVRVLQELIRLWVQHRRLVLDRRRVYSVTDEIDADWIQGCLLSTENLLSLGRVEKRTLFMRPLLEVLGGNRYLLQALIRGARECRRRSDSCMVARWLPPDERYHSLQACLNAVSSMFGPNYVHFNALNGETSDLFKSTWYCLTLATPTRPERREEQREMSGGLATCTFTDMLRQPRATLRVVVVNESEIRRIADSKICPPSWGFFNTRHAERYRMLMDFARNFRAQLLRTPPDSHAVSSRSPFSTEKGNHHRPDGGLMKRIHSQPNLAKIARSPGGAGGNPQAATFGGAGGGGPASGSGATPADAEPAVADPEQPALDGGCEESCFLRLHIPHYVGPTQLDKPQVVVFSDGGQAGGLRQVRSATLLHQERPSSPLHHAAGLRRADAKKGVEVYQSLSEEGLAAFADSWPPNIGPQRPAELGMLRLAS